jgi:hypothetical protein
VCKRTVPVVAGGEAVLLSLVCDCSAVLLEDCLDDVSSSCRGEAGAAAATDAAAAVLAAGGGDTDTDAATGTVCSIAAVTFHISTAPSLPAVAKCLPV